MSKVSNLLFKTVCDPSTIWLDTISMRSSISVWIWSDVSEVINEILKSINFCYSVVRFFESIDLSNNILSIDFSLLSELARESFKISLKRSEIICLEISQSSLAGKCLFHEASSDLIKVSYKLVPDVTDLVKESFLLVKGFPGETTLFFVANWSEDVFCSIPELLDISICIAIDFGICVKNLLSNNLVHLSKLLCDGVCHHLMQFLGSLRESRDPLSNAITQRELSGIDYVAELLELLLFECWNLVFNKVLKSFKKSLDLSFLGFGSKVFLVLIVPVEDVLDLSFKSLSFGRNNGVATCSIGDFLLELLSSSLSSKSNIANKCFEEFLHGEGRLISLLTELLLSDVAEFLNSFEH